MAETKEEPLRPAVAFERLQRQELKDQWNSWFRLRKLEAEGTFYHWFRVAGQEYFDKPVTWFKENVVEPLHDKYKTPYYHRHISRVPEVDQCKVLDNKCHYEASVQLRLDRQVDGNILYILGERLQDCMSFHEHMEGKGAEACVPLMEEYEEAELNFFIKYGELGDWSGANDVLMKQKHRMIWERRHPEIMAERDRAFKEHKRQITLGKFDSSFWKKNASWLDKEDQWQPYEMYHEETTFGPSALSKDWEFYRDVNKEGTAANQEEKDRVRYARDGRDGTGPLPFL